MNPRLYATYQEEAPAKGPVTCAECGCRLTPVEGSDGDAWRHFQFTSGKDARGCRTACVDEVHGRDGHVLDALAA